MICFENVRKRYLTGKGPKWVLRNCNAVFPTGRSVGILGRNGAGKSTLIRMLAGAEQPDSGRIRRFSRLSWPLGLRSTVSGSMTGRDGSAFVARLFGLDVEQVTAFVEEFAELGPYFDEPTSTYSSGMKARLNFGLSMAVDFDCYLIDEVTAVGDASFQNKCKRALDARRQHSSVIMVSHSDRTIRDFCDIGAILDDGTLNVFDSLDEAMRVYKELLV